MDERADAIAKWLGTGSINVFGVPFAGKDTQCTVLAKLLGAVVISSGDILRHDHGNAEIQRIMAEGGIIPSDLFATVMTPYLARDEFDGKPLILSEVGRVEGEQYVVMKAAAESGHAVKAVILLRLSNEEAFRRFDAAQTSHDRGARADDRREVLQTRLNAYEAMVTPVIEYYREHRLLVEVDGSLSRERVTEEIINAVTAFASKSIQA